MSDAHSAPAVVVMGVSCAGKSTVAASLAHRLETTWIDADRLHPRANIAKMAAGTPLEDEDRWAWLDRVGQAAAIRHKRDGIVIACSALKRRYRDRLRTATADVVFVHLTGSRELLGSRAAARSGHFMPKSLLDSQLAALEPLSPDEQGICIDVSLDVDLITDVAADWVTSLGAWGDRHGRAAAKGLALPASRAVGRILGTSGDVNADNS